MSNKYKQFLKAASATILGTNLAYALNIEFVDEPDFGVTNGKKVCISYPNSKNAEKILHIFNHELMHVLLDHIERGKRIVPSDKFHWWVWNLAADCVVNRFLQKLYHKARRYNPRMAMKIQKVISKDQNFRFPVGNFIKNAPTEVLYRWLLKQKLQFEETKTSFGKIVKAKVKLRDNTGKKSTYTFTIFVFERYTDRYDDRVEKININIHRKLFTDNVSADFYLEWKLSNKCGINFQKELEIYLKTFTAHKGEYLTFLIPNKKTMALRYPVAFPSRTLKKIKALVSIDTSGSITEHELSSFLSVLYKASDKLDMELIFCDTKVKEVINLKELDTNTIKRRIKNARPAGGGGTNYKPVFDHYFSKKNRYDLLIYFTDLFCNFPKKHPPRLIWAVQLNEFTYDKKPPYGKLVWV